jgi:hypothetical protein
MKIAQTWLYTPAWQGKLSIAGYQFRRNEACQPTLANVETVTLV